MIILAIDPGPEESAYVLLDGDDVRCGDKLPNEMLLTFLIDEPLFQRCSIAIEMIASYGRPVGREVFETCVWIGRFIQGAGRNVDLVYRRDVKRHLCGTDFKITDAVIRQRLYDIYGPGRSKAVGKKAAPGPLYGLKADMYAALAVAITYRDTSGEESGISTSDNRRGSAETLR